MYLHVCTYMYMYDNSVFTLITTTYMQFACTIHKYNNLDKLGCAVQTLLLKYSMNYSASNEPSPPIRLKAA